MDTPQTISVVGCKRLFVFPPFATPTYHVFARQSRPSLLTTSSCSNQLKSQRKTLNLFKSPRFLLTQENNVEICGDSNLLSYVIVPPPSCVGSNSIFCRAAGAGGAAARWSFFSVCCRLFFCRFERPRRSASSCCWFKEMDDWASHKGTKDSCPLVQRRRLFSVLLAQRRAQQPPTPLTCPDAENCLGSHLPSSSATKTGIRQGFELGENETQRG